MRIFLWMMLLGMTAALTGCRSDVIYGEPVYEKLSADEEKQMLSAACQAVMNHPKLLTPDEKRAFPGIRPDVLIDYHADREGKALYTWVIDRKTVRLSMTGRFLTGDIRVKAGVSRQSEVRLSGQSASEAPRRSALKTMVKMKMDEEMRMRQAPKTELRARDGSL